MAKLAGQQPAQGDPMHSLENASFQRESAAHLVRAFERGLDDQADILGWHGTSIEAMQLALRQGVLPCSPVAHAHAPAHSSVFFFPVDLKRDFVPPVPGKYAMEGRLGAERYGAHTAEIHFTMRTLGLDFTDPAHHRAVRTALMHMESWEDEGESALKVLAKLGVSEERFTQVSKEAPKQGGVLLALSTQHTKELSIVDGDRAGWDKRIVCPGGLPLSAITGIEPLGDKEYEFFERLQGTLGSNR